MKTHRFWVCLIWLSIILPAASKADDYIWIAPGSGDWTGSGNWGIGPTPVPTSLFPQFTNDTALLSSSTTEPLSIISLNQPLNLESVTLSGVFLLRLGATDALGRSSAVVLSTEQDGLDLNGFSQTIGSLSDDPGCECTPGGLVTLGGATLSTGTDNTDTEFSGIISGSGGLTKLGTGAFTLSGANTYTGPTTINAGTLRAGGANVFSAASAVLIAPGASLNLNNFAQTIGSLADTGAGAGARTVALGSATLSTGTDNTSTGFSGAITGTGGLTKTGSGTFTLAGSQTYTGATLVEGGTLNLTGGLAGSLVNRSTVELSGSGTRLISGNINNQGTFKLTDTTAQFDGTFTNNGAYISDPSTSQFNDLTVGSSGYLAGGAGDTFVVTGNLVNNSTQSTLWNTSNAALVFASPTAGSPASHTFQLASLDRGRTAAGYTNNFSWGSLTLNSGNSLQLTAANGLSGPAALYAKRIVLPDGLSQLSSVSSDYNVYFDPSLAANLGLRSGGRFGSGSGQLLASSLEPGASAAANLFGLTPNQTSFAQALDEACLSSTGQLASRCLEIQGLTPAQKASAVSSLTPDQVPGQTGIAVKFNATRMDAPLARLASLRAGFNSPVSLSFNGMQIPLERTAPRNNRDRKGGAAGDGNAANLDDVPFRDSPLGIFVQTRFNFGDQSTTTWDRGFDFQTRNVTIGADYRLSDQLVTGLAFNYTNASSHYAGSAGSMNTDSFIGALYGSYYLPQDYYVDWVANYGGSDYEFMRQFSYPGFINRSTSKPTGNQYSFALSSGKDFNYQEWQFGPYVRFEYVNLHIDSYRESGGAGLSVDVDQQTNHSFVSDFGAQVSRAISLPWGILTPAIRFEWEHQYLNDNRLIQMRLANAAPGVGNFSLQTGSPDRDYVNLGGSVSAALPNGGAAFLRYESRLGQSAIDQHLVELGVRILF